MGITLSDERIAHHWEVGVARFAEDFKNEWLIAANAAIDDASVQPDEESSVYWWISLAGNLLWAATVFFPPAGAAAAFTEATFGLALVGSIGERMLLRELAWQRATKAASIIGAIVGAGAITQLKGKPATGPNAKSFLKDLVADRADELYQFYVDEIPSWVRKDLIPYYHRLESLSPADQRAANYHGWTEPDSVGHVQRMEYAFEHLFFPNIRFKNRSRDLRVLMVTEMQKAMDQFVAQFRTWFMGQVGSWTTGSGIAASIDPFGGFKRYEKEHPFEPRIVFSGVPREVQTQSHQTKIGPIIVDWKYGS